MNQFYFVITSTIILQLGGDIGDKVADALLDAIRDALPRLFQQLSNIITDAAKGAIETVAGPALDLLLYVPAPLPIGVYFQKPANSPWGRIFDYMWGATIPLGFALLVVAWQVGQAGSSLGIIDEKKTRELDRGLFAGLLLIPISYVLVAMFLQIVNAITTYIAPSPQEVSNAVLDLLTFDQLIGDSSTFIIAYLLSGTLLVLALLAVAVNIVRVMMLLLLSVVLPVLMALKLAGIPYIENWANKFISMFVSLGLSTIITAAGLRLTLLILGGGRIRLDGIPADNFIGPVLALVPFAIGVVMPAGAILNSLNISQVARTLSTAAGAASGMASSVSSKAGNVGSLGKRAGKKAGADRAISTAKSEYSEMRQRDGPGGDELGSEINADSSPPDPPSGGGGNSPSGGTGGSTQLPATTDASPGSVPDSAGGYSAGNTDHSGTPWGSVGPDGTESEDDLLGERGQESAWQEDGDEADSEDDTDAGRSPPFTAAGGGDGPSSGGAGGGSRGGGSPSSGGAGGGSGGGESASSGGAGGGGTSQSSAKKGQYGPASSQTPGGGSATGQNLSDEKGQNAPTSPSPKTTGDRIANQPSSIADDTDVSADQLKYQEKGNMDDFPDPNPDTAGYFEDAAGNEIPADTGGKDLEPGQTYDVTGATVEGSYESEPADAQPDAVSKGVVTPETDENGRYQSLNVGDAHLEESAQSYREDLTSRSKDRVKHSPEELKGAAGRVKNKPGETVSTAKRSLVDSVDDALLTEDARDELGKQPTEVRSGARVQAERGSRVATGEIEQTWTDDQTDMEMAAVQFDNQDDRTVVPKDELSLSVSSPGGKTSTEGD